jgi:hypothetical protein
VATLPSDVRTFTHTTYLRLLAWAASRACPALPAGVDGPLGRYLQLLADDKAATEYMRWLRRLQAFVAA